MGEPQPPLSAPDSPSADDLDKELLDQLHAATLKASDSCFEMKKLCATVLVPTATLISVFSNKQLNSAVFVAGILIIVAFWLADAVGYYYQRRLRAKMTAIWERRAARCPEQYTHWPNDTKVSAFRAAFNSSMVYYLILSGLLGIAFAAFHLGGIPASAATP